MEEDHSDELQGCHDYYALNDQKLTAQQKFLISSFNMMNDEEDGIFENCLINPYCNNVFVQCITVDYLVSEQIDNYQGEYDACVANAKA